MFSASAQDVARAAYGASKVPTLPAPPPQTAAAAAAQGGLAAPAIGQAGAPSALGSLASAPQVSTGAGAASPAARLGPTAPPAGAALQPSAPAIPLATAGQPASAFGPFATATAPPLIGDASILIAAQAHIGSASSPVAPIPAAGARTALEALVARHLAMIVQAELMEGPAAAMRELRARTRDLPVGTAGEIVAGAAPTLRRAADALAGGGPLERVERVTSAFDRNAVSSAPLAADLAGGLEAGAFHEPGGHVTREVAQAIANAERMTAERLIAFGHGVAFGAGLALPLALIDVHRERGNGDAARLLEAALVDGLARLVKRLVATVATLARTVGPVAFEWAQWRAQRRGGGVERRLRARLEGEPGLLEAIDDALEAVDAVGFGALSALERLSRWRDHAPGIIDVWRSAVAAPETAFAIAQSLAAQHAVAQRLTPGLQSEPAADVVEATIDIAAALRLYAALGFEGDRLETLAQTTVARHLAVQLGGGWIRVRRARDRDAEAAFGRLVAFLEGQGVPANRYVETIELADLDPDAAEAAPSAGVPLMRRFDLDLVAVRVANAS